VLHPGLIDAANWTITDGEVAELRRRLLGLDWRLRKENIGMAYSGVVAPSMVRIYVYGE